jgi:hypothetical protein
MFYASCLTFKAYLSPTKLVESCKAYLLSTGFLDWTACLYQSDHDQSAPETETYSRNEENLAPEYRPQDEMHPPTPDALPDPVESIYFQTKLYAPLATLKIMAFKEYGGVKTGLGHHIIGIAFWADFGKRIGWGRVVLPPKMSTESIPPEDWSLVQRHLDTARSLIPAGERQYLKEKYGFDVENSLVLSSDRI